MTRNRSRADGVPTDLNREYYRQRASTALIITEGTQPSADGQGYLLTPGLHTNTTPATSTRRWSRPWHRSASPTFTWSTAATRNCCADFAGAGPARCS
uniref:oxidoreductase n=1 Tax=Paractinoplanes polyasparticus TaxID=2856853 RepID=UPI0021060859|nr:hypothetical protein [Actinoplanes polyasparticus]